MLSGVKLRELLTDNPTDLFKEPQAAIWSILAPTSHGECEQSQQKEVEANKQNEAFKSDEQSKDVPSGLQEGMQSAVQKDVQSDERGEGKGDYGNIQSEDQGREDEEFAKGLGVENEFGKIEDLQLSAGCRRRQTNSTQVVSSVGFSGMSSPEDSRDTEKTTG